MAQGRDLQTVICREHGETVVVDSLEQAGIEATRTTAWCDGCLAHGLSDARTVVVEGEVAPVRIGDLVDVAMRAPGDVEATIVAIEVDEESTVRLATILEGEIALIGGWPMSAVVDAIVEQEPLMF